VADVHHRQPTRVVLRGMPYPLLSQVRFGVPPM
jgi:hypothetical protein